MSLFRKKVQGRYLVHAPIANINQAINNHYASQGLQLFLKPQTGPQSIDLTCTTDMSLSSWGETMEFVLNPADENNTYLDISSQATWGMVDFGKNKENVERVISALAAYFSIEMVNPPTRA